MQKLGHIQRICQSSTAVIQSAHSSDSAVVTLSPSQETTDIPPIFQIVNLPEFSRKLRLVVDSASPIIFVNANTWLDLNKPESHPTTLVLGAFEGQPIYSVGWFEAKVSQNDAPQNVEILQICVKKG